MDVAGRLRRKDSVRIILPYPPSTNRYWRFDRGKVHISDPGQRYREEVAVRLRMQGVRPGHELWDARLAEAIEAFPPDRRIRDIDNIQKPLNDSLQHGGLYRNDSQLDLLQTQRCEVRPSGLIIVNIEPMPLRVCPTCGQAIPKMRVNHHEQS